MCIRDRQYAHGNEPSHHVAYLYACAGEPWKTQKYVAHIMNELYNDSSSGYAGNDDSYCPTKPEALSFNAPLW